MAIYNYNKFLNEELALTADTDIKKEKSITFDLKELVSKKVKNFIYINIFKDTADDKEVIPGESYYTLFKYKGDNDRYKDKKIIYKIKIKDKINLKNKAYTKLVWDYERIPLASLANGKTVIKETYALDYETEGKGISGKYMIKDLKNINDITNEDKDLWIREEMKRTDDKFIKIKKELVSTVESPKSQELQGQEVVKEKPEEKGQEVVKEKPEEKGQEVVKEKPEEDVKSKEIQLDIKHTPITKKEKQLKKDQEIANKNLANPKNDAKYDAKKQVQMKKAHIQVQAKEKKKEQAQVQTIQQEIQQTIEKPSTKEKGKKGKVQNIQGTVKRTTYKGA